MVSPRTRGSSHVWRMQRRFALERRRRVERRLERRVDLSDLCKKEKKKTAGQQSCFSCPSSPTLYVYIDS